MTTRDPLVMLEVSSLLDIGRKTSALKVARDHRLRAQEQMDKTWQVIESAQRSLEKSSLSHARKGGDV